MGENFEAHLSIKVRHGLIPVQLLQSLRMDYISIRENTKITVAVSEFDEHSVG